MAGGAILGRWRVKCAGAPILGNLTMTAEAKRWLAFALMSGMGRTMTAMAGCTILFGNRFVLDFILLNLGFNFRMARETYLPRQALDKIGLIGAMSAVT